MDQRQDEFRMDDSGATEHMTQDPAGFEDCMPETVEQHVKGASGTLLPIVGYGHLHLERIGNFEGPPRELARERVAHMPNPGKHNLFSMKRLAQSLDGPKHFYPTDAVIRPRRGGKPLTFRPLRPQNGS